MWLRAAPLSHEPRPVDGFAREALIDVRTFYHEKGELAFRARVVGLSSESHLRVRSDDGLIFIVPAADCRLVEGNCQ